MKQHIFLIGFMGSGKSTVAKKLQEVLQIPLIEMDETIEQEQRMPISSIFEQHGEAFFRDLETDLLRRICQSESAVVSCGGGTVIRKENRELMKAGSIVLLTAEPQTILNRVRYSRNRPLLEGKKTVEDIRTLMEARKSLYMKAADIMVSTDGKTPEQLTNEIKALLN